MNWIIVMCVSFEDNEVQQGFSISHYHSRALLLSFQFCSLITFTFKMQNLISKHIYNNEPLDWKDCNLLVITKMSLRAPTTCLIFRCFKRRLASFCLSPLRSDVAKTPASCQNYLLHLWYCSSGFSNRISLQPKPRFSSTVQMWQWSCDHLISWCKPKEENKTALRPTWGVNDSRVPRHPRK